MTFRTRRLRVRVSAVTVFAFLLAVTLIGLSDGVAYFVVNGWFKATGVSLRLDAVMYHMQVTVPAVSLAVTVGAVALFLSGLLVPAVLRERRVSVRRVGVSVGLVFLLLVGLNLTVVPVVRATIASTGYYYLDTPLPLAAFYVGKYSNASVFAVNGSNWDNFVVTSNATYVLDMVIGNCTDGQTVFIQGGVSYGLTTIYTDTYCEVRTANVTLVEGQVVCFDTSTFAVTLAKADDEVTMGLGYVYLNLWNATASTRTICASNCYVSNSAWAWTPNDILYVSPLTAGAMTATIPSIIDHVVMQVGTAISATIIKFQNLMTPVVIKQGTVQDATFLITFSVDTYYAWYGANSTLAFTNATLLGICQQCNNAISSGLIVLKQLQKPAGMSISSGVQVLEIYNGMMRTYTNSTAGYRLETPYSLSSFCIDRYGTTGLFYAINGSTWDNFVEHANGSLVVQTCIDNVTADGGGFIFVGAADYGDNGTVLVGENCTLILETGVVNLPYTTTGTGIVLLYNNGYVTIDAPLDMMQHQVVNGVFHAGSTKPSSPVEAQFFYDTDDHVLYVWNTTDWVDCFAGVGGGAGWETKGSYDYFVYQDDSTNTTVIDNEGNKAYESANDGLAINWAFDNGDEVYLAADTYTLIDDTGIVLDDTGDTLRGGGYSTRITVEAGFDGNIITVEATGARLDNFRIDGTGQTSGHGMFFDGSSGTITSFFRIQDCFGDGIHVGDTEWVVDNQMGGKIQFGTITNNGGNGLYLDFDSTDWEVFDILISNHDGTGDAGIVVDAGATMISFCHLWGNYYNVLLCPAHSISRLRFVSNGVMDNDYHGLYKSSAYYFHDSVIVGNTFWANGYSGAYNHSDSIYFGSTGDIISVTITGNSFYGFKEGGQPEVRCTRYAINDANDQMDYCVIGLNTFREYFIADPTNIATAHNEESLNTVYQCG